MSSLSLSLKEEFRVLRERRENRERGTPTYRLIIVVLGHTHTHKKTTTDLKYRLVIPKKRDAKVSTH